MAKKLINYSEIRLPTPKQLGVDHSNYNFKQRRAEMIKVILTQGHTDLNVGKLSKLYGVTIGQISQDKQVIIPYISEHYFKADRVVSDAIVAKQRALKGALEAKQWSIVNKIADSLLEMAYDFGLIKKEATRIDVNMREEIEKIVLPKITIRTQDLD